MSIPPGCFEHPGDGGLHLWGGRDVRFFTIAFLPTHLSHVLFLQKKVAVKSGEDRPNQYGMRFLPVPEGQGGQVSVIAHLHPCAPPRDANLLKHHTTDTTASAT